MVCATRILVLLCLLAAEVRPEELSSGEASVEAEEGRIKRQNFNFGGRGQPSNQQFFNRRPSGQSQFVPSRGVNSNRFTAPSQNSGGNRFVTRGQPAFQRQQQSVRNRTPQRLTSPSPSQRQVNSQSPRLLNNDPLGLFRGGQQSQPSRSNLIQRSPHSLSTPQQIINFQRQQQQQTLANIRNSNQGFRSPQQSFTSQRFSPNPSFQTVQQLIRQNQQFRPSPQIIQGTVRPNGFRPAPVQQLQVQTLQNPQQQVRTQRPQSNNANPQAQQSQQQQLQQQLLQRQRQQALLQQFLQNQRQNQLRQQQQQQQQQLLRQQQLRQQQLRQQQLQQQQLRQQQLQQQQLRQQQLQQQQLRQQQLQQQQLRQQQLQQQNLQRQPTQPTTAPRPATVTQASFGVPLRPTAQPVRATTISRPASSFGVARPTAAAQFSQAIQPSSGVPFQTTRQPSRPTTIVRPTSNTQQSFGVPLQSVRQPSQSQPVVRPAIGGRLPASVPIQSIPTLPQQLSQAARPTSAPASFGVPLQASRQPASARPIQQIRPQQRPQRPNTGVLLTQTRPQSPVSQVQNQRFPGAGGLINTVSQISAQGGRPTFSAGNAGGFRIVVDDDDFNDFTIEDSRTDELFDSREIQFGSGIRSGFVGRTGFGRTPATSFGNNRGVGRAPPPRFQVVQDFTREDFTDEVDSREFFGSRRPLLSGGRGFQRNFGTRNPRVTQEIDLTFEDLTRENFTDEFDDTFEIFDD